MKVVFHFDAGSELLAELESLKAQAINVVCCPESSDEPFMSEIADADVLWHVLKPVTQEIIAAAPKLKLIQKIGVGVNTIDLEAADEAGIKVCNMPGTNSNAVAEMTLMLMLAVLRKLSYIDRECRSGGWSLDKQITESFGEIKGRTVGLVGFGEIPKILAPILTAMGARVIYTATSQKDVPYGFVDLDELITTAEIVSLHIPLVAETDQIISKNRIEAMKQGAILVNTGRGGLVDEAALIKALTSGALRGAGLDVFAREPVRQNNPLLKLDNVVVAPHVAWLTNETFSRSVEIAVFNSQKIMDGGVLKHCVNDL